MKPFVYTLDYAVKTTDQGIKGIQTIYFWKFGENHSIPLEYISMSVEFLTDKQWFIQGAK